ncbi:MAG: hypothetical protein ACFE9Y_13690 [Promethearchaeota archaeon]
MKKKIKIILLLAIVTSSLVIISTSVFSSSTKSSRRGIIVEDRMYRELTLIESTPLRGCNGLIFDKDGALYVCQTSANTISKISLRWGRSPLVKNFVGPYHGVYCPDDITVDDEGNFYATSAITGEVYKIDSKGMKKVIARGLSGPNGISYDEKTGRLFMTECFWGNRVWELDPKGELPPTLVTADLAVPEGFDIRDNKLVVPDFGTWRIVEVDMDTGVVTNLTTTGIITPIALKIGPDGYIYTVELATGAVKRVSPDGLNIETVVTLLPGLDNLAFGPDGNLYVSSYHDCTIWKVDTDSGEYTTLFPMGINSAASIVVKDENIYLCDSIMIRRMDEEGNLYKTWANAWLSTTGYHLPITMTNGLGDYLFTADFIDGIVVNVNPNIAEDWSYVAYSLSSPAGMELDEENLMLYIAEYGAGQVIGINLTSGEKIVIAENLAGPVDLVIKDGVIYVAETLAGRITKIDIKSGFKEVFLSGYTGKPKGLAWDYRGNLLIVDTSMRKLIKVNMENLCISIIASNLPLEHTTYYHHPLIWDATSAITVNEDGDIYMIGSDGSAFKFEYRGKYCK